jgi:ABC-2 type transport system ATP-binding protein
MAATMQNRRARIDPSHDGEPVRVDALTKVYGAKRAVDQLTFAAEWGKVTGFLGPNGAGKSTTLRILLGLTRPTSGTALVLGQPYERLRRPVATVGALLETQQFHPGRSAREHLLLLAIAGGIPHRRVDEVLGFVELSGDAGRKVGHYSLGMRQRLGLAAALLGDPALLVLDEPANGLDPPGIRWLRETLRRFADRGGAVLVSSHNLPEVANLADDLVVINRGRVVTHTTVDQLTTRPAVRVRTPDVERFRRLMSEAGVDAELVGPQDLRIEGAAERVGTMAAAAGLVIYGMQPEERSLEEAFLGLIEDGKEDLR